jgi:hypothetical protein
LDPHHQNKCYVPLEDFGEPRCLFLLNKGIALRNATVMLKDSVW